MVEDVMRRSRVENFARAFTLVELLVVISIIAILISILITTLNAARQKSWDAGCLSNCRQCVTAWLTYTSERGHFPAADFPENPNPNQTYEYSQVTAWAGVDWYTDELREAGRGHPAKERPLNEYLSMNPHQTSGGEVVHCPGDNQIFQAEFSGSINQEPDVQVIESLSPWLYGESSAPYGSSTFHGAMGTSYIANEWLWVSAGAPWGLRMDRSDQRELWYKKKNRPEFIESPSRFTMFGDSGIMNVLYYGSVNANTGFVSIPFVPHNFRHGGYNTSMAFLDGSARMIEMPIGYHVGLVGQTYSFIPQPNRVARLQEAMPDFHFNGRGFAGSPPPSVYEAYGLEP